VEDEDMEVQREFAINFVHIGLLFSSHFGITLPSWVFLSAPLHFSSCTPTFMCNYKSISKTSKKPKGAYLTLSFFLFYNCCKKRGGPLAADSK